MAGFMALTSRQGEFTDDFEVPDPAQFGLPTEDDGTRSDPLLSGVSNAVTAYRPDVAAVQAAPTRVVVAAGTESRGTLTWRTAAGTAELLGQELTVFPSHHGGFMGGEHGYAGEPEAFAARLREVLGSLADDGVLPHPGVHGDAGGDADVDRPGGAELGDGHGEVRAGARLLGETGPFLAEQQQAAPGQVARSRSAPHRGGCPRPRPGRPLRRRSRAARRRRRGGAGAGTGR